MKAIIDLVLFAILVICAWSGYKKGLIMGVGGIFAILVALYCANLLSFTFSGDVITALRPFAAGYVENRIDDEEDGVRKRMNWDENDYSIEDLLAESPESRSEFACELFKSIGIYETTSATMAEQAVAYAEEKQTDLTTACVQILCETVSYVGCFILAFLMILIILIVIGNLPNLSFKLPNMDLVNDIAGALVGLLTGMLYCAILTWALKFMGIVIGEGTLSLTKLGAWFLKHDFLFTYLGI